MSDISLAEAKAGLSDVINRVAAGKTMRITRRGKPVVVMTAVGRTFLPVDNATASASFCIWIYRQSG